MERLISRSRSRQTGTVVLLVDRGSDDDGGGRWETVCDEHGGVCSHETRALAQSFVPVPAEWCEDCTFGPGTLDGSAVAA